jgi:hypothetical protein
MMNTLPVAIMGDHRTCSLRRVILKFEKVKVANSQRRQNSAKVIDKRNPKTLA